MPLKYKEYQNKHVPYCSTIGDYLPPDFDEDTYPDLATYEAKLGKYLEELRPYVHHLQESVRLRQLHYERQIEARGLEEELGHRHFRLEFTKVVQEAVDTLSHWNTIQCANLQERQRKQEAWQELKMRRRAKIDCEASVAKCKNELRPRITQKMQQAMEKERQLQRAMRAAENEEAVESALARAKQESLERESLMSLPFKTAINGKEFWNTIDKELRDLPQTVLPSIGDKISDEAFLLSRGIPCFTVESTMDVTEQYARCVMEMSRPVCVLVTELALLSEAQGFAKAVLSHFVMIATTKSLVCLLEGEAWDAILPVLCRFPITELESLLRDLSGLRKSCGHDDEGIRAGTGFLTALWCESIGWRRFWALQTLIHLVESKEVEKARKLFPLFAGFVKTPLPVPKAKGYRIRGRWCEKYQLVKSKIVRYQQCGKLPRC